MKSVTFNTTNGLPHTKWNCKYHIVFAQKYRREMLVNKSRYQEIRLKLREAKGITVLDVNEQDHIHMCVKMPTSANYSVFNMILKGK